MQRIAIILFISFFSFCKVCSAQSWLWGKGGIKIDSTSNGIGCGTATDASGNVYLTGQANNLVFGSDTIKNNNVFLTKFSPAGNVIWAKSSAYFNLNGAPYFFVATDKKSNVYITGNFQDSAKFGLYKLTCPPSTSGKNIYLTKYNSNGTLLWAKQAFPNSGSSTVQISSITTDIYGHVFLAGSFYDTVSFGSFKLIAPYPLQECAFITKFDSSGNVLWAKQSISVNKFFDGASVGSVATDIYGNAYITGGFVDTTFFGPYTLYSFPMTNFANAFLVKYDSNGNVRWAKQTFGATKYCSSGGEGIATDGQQSIYVSGGFYDTVSFGPLTFYANYGVNIFLAKYDTSGNVKWVQQGKNIDSTDLPSSSVAIDTLNHVYLNCNSYSIYNSASIAFSADTFSIRKTTDGASLIIEFDTSGTINCGTIVAGGGSGYNGVATVPSGGYVYLSGYLNDTVVFGIDTLRGGPMPFLAKWQPCGITGINEINPETIEAKLYPNPNGGKFSLECPGLNEKTRIEIYNALGEMIYGTNLNSSTTEISLSEKPSGVYLYRVTAETGITISSGKFIVY